MSEIIPIGVVERDATERVPPKELRDEESTVVVFHLHRSDDPGPRRGRGDRRLSPGRRSARARTTAGNGRLRWREAGTPALTVVGPGGETLRIALDPDVI